MLGKIERIPVREHWKNEERDFTPWLAKDDNIQILSDEIGIDIEVQATEYSIGSYKADIVGQDSDGNIVIIENQLEKSDHKHLGFSYLHMLLVLERRQSYGFASM